MRDPDDTSAAGVSLKTAVRADPGGGEADAARRLFELLGATLQGGRLRVVVTSAGAEEGAGETVFLVRFEDDERARGAGVDGIEKLSACEREVARLVAKGYSNDEVARQLGKSVLTVKKQLRAIFQKLQVPTRARLGALLR